ncbi:peptidoglycan editing factor PgeF [Chelatococcus sp. SYSU_G07232]|uniref:Purine nucleoside phosphorylase n=1 Tax=Chelatococcus albus TaxID=3047466 RepID=A0ABT7AIV3_9HYPH|nr:peptidoglycan editing factor PgeF [Chelatococcus sp. SYSU_G07232]MDJ1159283.1 peptidoglycan editing factor PgeF [Chelatococcus sp. SYSU_G07232]
MFIEADILKDLPGIRHAFFTREGGVSQGIYTSLNGGVGSADDREAVAENRRRMAAHFGVTPERLLGLYQVHSSDVLVADGPWLNGERPKADAMVTATPGLVLGVSSADCGPILFADAEAGVVGAAHSGWKGAFTGVVEAVLDAMERIGARRERTLAVLGPTISRAAYEVGPEFVAHFREADAANARFFAASPRPGHAMFDLPAYIAARCAAAGIGRFTDLGLCTYADERRFYSYRRTTHRGEPDYGRLISAIALTR